MATENTQNPKYEFIREIGRGAMGSIHEATQPALRRRVAIKVLHPEFSGDPAISQRFDREARAAARLSHPNCIAILDYGTLEDKGHYIAMEYVDGLDLSVLLDQRLRLDPLTAIRIAQQIAAALEEAHSKKVIHRDLKPANIMIVNATSESMRIKVCDFGIAKIQDSTHTGSFQTMSGIVCGTPDYMAPEQARGLPLDGRADLYSLGIMLFEMVTGKRPFSAPSALDLLSKHIQERPPKPSQYQPGIPEALEGLILQMLEKDRQQRPSNATMVRKQLERIEMTLDQIPDTLAGEGLEGIAQNGSSTITDTMRSEAPMVDPPTVDSLPAFQVTKKEESPKGPATVRPGTPQEHSGSRKSAPWHPSQWPLWLSMTLVALTTCALYMLFVLKIR